MSTVRHTLTALALAALGASAFAQTVAPAASAPRTVDQRQQMQEQRIQNGIQSGAITQQEAQRLRAEQGLINRQEQKANADGVVTKKEQRRLDRMQDLASKDIHRQRHDAQTRPDGTPGQPGDPNHFNRRKEMQDQRIENGMKSGAITEAEAKQLHAEQQSVKDAHQAAKADGVVTKAERKNINQMQDAASKDIHQQRHDKQVKQHKK